MSRGTLDTSLLSCPFAYRTFTPYGLPFQVVQLRLNSIILVHNPQQVSLLGLGSFPFARRYLGNRLFFLFLRVLRCFSSPGLPLHTYLFSMQYQILSGGFPHSEISGSKPICGSPKLIAAYHVLRRLLVPRHPPCALTSLTLFNDRGHIFNRCIS